MLITFMFLLFLFLLLHQRLLLSLVPTESWAPYLGEIPPLSFRGVPRTFFFGLLPRWGFSVWGGWGYFSPSFCVMSSSVKSPHGLFPFFFLLAFPRSFSYDHPDTTECPFFKGSLSSSYVFFPPFSFCGTSACLPFRNRLGGKMCEWTPRPLLFRPCRTS